MGQATPQMVEYLTTSKVDLTRCELFIFCIIPSGFLYYVVICAWSATGAIRLYTSQLKNPVTINLEMHLVQFLEYF